MPDSTRQTDPPQLLTRARQGDLEALGELLEAYRPYLSLLARLKSGKSLQPKVSDSDLVQDTCLSAYRDFVQFRGAREEEFAAWLREIMAHVNANHMRNLRRQRRDVRLERQLYNLLNQSSQMMERALADPDQSPSSHALHRERAVMLAKALDELPSDYREVLIQRELEGKPLAELAQTLNRSTNAVQKLWARAVVQLRRQLQSFETP